MMKKVFSTLAITLVLAVTASAQSSDGFFRNNSEAFRDDSSSDPSYSALLNPQHQAPLGDGLLILTVLGAGFVAMKRKK